MRNKHAVFLTILSIVVFGAALTQVGFYTGAGPRAAWGRGWYLLLIGWAGPMGLEFSWFANPLLLTTWALCIGEKKTAALLLSVLTLVPMISFYFTDQILVDEGGGRAKITGYGSGYWLWLSSAVLALAAAAIMRKEPNQTPATRLLGPRF